jgi:dihydrofolate synthase/folylpolyglutamate synthase
LASARPPRRQRSRELAGGALAYLRSRSELGKKFGLATIQALVEELGHPERAYPTLLVAGTNGKGSVVAYLDAALRAARLRVGRYTSPHLVRVHERIAVDGREISERDLDRAIAAVREAAERLIARGALSAQPTYFEALTAAAFLHFRRRRVDVAVLEVGLGGRLDATNVSDPLASAIVSIDLDHEAFLGRTLARVAREKAGVLRPGREAIVGPLAEPARRAVLSAARRVGARITDAAADVSVEEVGARIHVRTPSRSYPGLQPLPGAHQVDNLVVALRLLEAARRAGLRVDLGAAFRGIHSVSWPGRLQWVQGKPRLLLDGAHNPAGARALASYLSRVKTFVLLFGVMRDKDVESMARTLFPLAREIVLTRPVSPRAATPAEIARRAGRFASRAHLVSDPVRALALARRLAGRDGTVVVAGSLYLVGAILPRLLRRSGAISRARAGPRPFAARR